MSVYFGSIYFIHVYNYLVLIIAKLCSKFYNYQTCFKCCLAMIEYPISDKLYSILILIFTILLIYLQQTFKALT